MLAEFIEKNGLKAKILPYRAKNCIAKCRLFDAGAKTVCAVFYAKQKPSLQKIKAAAGAAELRTLTDKEAEELTGYKARFMPPVSVYGVLVLVDKRVARAENLCCIVGEEKTMEISGAEILSANEEALAAGIAD